MIPLMMTMNTSYAPSIQFLNARPLSPAMMNMRGIEFSATAFFLVVVVNQWRQYRTRLPFLIAAVCALGFYLLLGKEYFLIPTLVSCVAALLFLRKPVEQQEGTTDE